MEHSLVYVLRCFYVGCIESESEVTQSCPTLCDPMDSRLHQASPSMGFSRQEYWRGLPFLLQGIFPTQGLNPGPSHCRQTLYLLSHQGSPNEDVSEVGQISTIVSSSTWIDPLIITSVLPYLL